MAVSKSWVIYCSAAGQYRDVGGLQMSMETSIIGTRWCRKKYAAATCIPAYSQTVGDAYGQNAQTRSFALSSNN